MNHSKTDDSCLTCKKVSLINRQIAQLLYYGKWLNLLQPSGECKWGAINKSNFWHVINNKEKKDEEKVLQAVALPAIMKDVKEQME